jgi:hypothetical protein
MAPPWRQFDHVFDALHGILGLRFGEHALGNAA